MFSWCLIIFKLDLVICVVLGLVSSMSLVQLTATRSMWFLQAMYTVGTKWMPSPECCVLCCVFHFQLIFLTCLDRKTAQGQFSNFLCHCCSWCCDFWYSCILQEWYCVCVQGKNAWYMECGADINTKNNDCALKYVLIQFSYVCILPECLKWRLP